MLEVERKARIADPEALEARIATMGAFVGESVKEDRYYLPGWASGRAVDLAMDPIFRVRVEGGQATIGWKSRTFEGATEVNVEREIRVGDPGPVIEWIEAYLGMRPFVVKRKRTRAYRLAGALAGATAELNRVDGLGGFLEVEVLCEPDGRAEAIALVAEVFSRLGVPEESVEPRYYIDLIMEAGRGTT